MTCRVRVATLPNREIDKRQSSHDIHSASRSNRPDRIRTLIQSSTCRVDDRDASGATALIWAANFAAVDAVEELLWQGADPNAVDGDGVTAIMAALKAWILGEHQELEAIITMLIEAGADHVAALKSVREDGEDDLECAIQLALIRRERKNRSRAKVIAYTPMMQQIGQPECKSFFGSLLMFCLSCCSVLIIGSFYLIMILGMLATVFAR